VHKLAGTASYAPEVVCRHARLARPRPCLEGVPPALSRQLLAWAALAAFLGSAVGLTGTFSTSSWPLWAAPSGGLVATLSLLGVASLLGWGSWAARVGVAFLLLWLSASLSFVLYSSLWRPEPGSIGAPPFAFLALLHASLWGGSLATLPFALGSLFGRRRRLGAVLLLLSVPGVLLLLLYVPSAGADISLSEIEALVGPLSSPAAGVGVPEAVLWVCVGGLLFGEARRWVLSKVRREVAEENRRKALRLYEEGLGRSDPSAVEEMVSEDFREIGGGHRGKPGGSSSSRTCGRATPTCRSRWKARRPRATWSGRALRSLARTGAAG
jgi:hypothetical protein